MFYLEGTIKIQIRIFQRSLPQFFNFVPYLLKKQPIKTNDEALKLVFFGLRGLLIKLKPSLLIFNHRTIFSLVYSPSEISLTDFESFLSSINPLKDTFCPNFTGP